MDSFGAILKAIAQFPIRHWGKILAIPFIAIFWTFVIFPYGDLRGLASSQISKAMPGTALEFQNVSLGLGFPPPIVLEEVEFERPGIPTLKADRVSASPTFRALSDRLPGGSIEASGLFDGSLRAALDTTVKESEGTTPALRHAIKGSFADVQVGALTSYLKRAGILGLVLKGQISSDFDLSIDPSLQQPPMGAVTLSGTAFDLPATSIPLPGMGPVQLPSLQFSKIGFNGRLQEGTFNLENLVLGQSTDSLSVRARGQLQLALQNIGGRVMANVSNVDLSIEINVSEKLMGSILGQAIDLLVSKYKQKSSASPTSTYRFRLRLPQLSATPSFSEAGAFD